MKQFLKNIVFKIYKAAHLEYRHRMAIADIKQKNESATFDDTVAIANAEIKNFRKRRECITIGKQTVVYGELMLFKHGGNISIGDYCYIGPGTRIWSAKKISIGNRVLVSHNVNIHDNVSHPLGSKERHEDFMQIFYGGGLQENVDLREAEVVIGDDVWIGFNAVILKGVTIGNGAIIGAGAFITNDVPANAVVVGNPQRIMRYNEQE